MFYGSFFIRISGKNFMAIWKYLFNLAFFEVLGKKVFFYGDNNKFYTANRCFLDCISKFFSMNHSDTNGSKSSISL